MSRALRGVGAQLSLALLLVVAIALGIVYEAVVPSLQKRLVSTRVAQLEQAAARLRRDLPPSAVYDPDIVATAAARIGARVILMQRLTDTPLVIQDSVAGQLSSDVEDDPVAVEATKTGRARHGTVREGDDHYAEAAVPVLDGAYVLMLRDSVQNQFGSVHLVQRRLLLSAGAALLIALLLGYGGARMFARRIRRLERAADRIASGRFNEPVRDSGGGELRRLADAFERMRVRLAQLDDARREFVANASHELRTPLFSLGGFLELLDDEVLDEPTRREFLTSMREQVVRLTKLASDLLDLTRLDAGRLTVEREPVDLAALAEELAEEFRPVAQGTRHSLEVAAPEPVFADADELRVLQIGRILVENALRHTPPGTSVRIRPSLRDGRAVLEVEDEGPGIPADQRDQLFERFYRLDGTRASGSGLGLAIARELAELMDGAIRIESRPGRTVFALVLPQATTEPGEPFSRQNRVAAGT
ncbi:MAG: HAMP domain-containing histidine kinase [Actinomycetota bacterium]|nr:HAMP domain-containing histidine kinase [Actinomycetota bacterium]